MASEDRPCAYYDLLGSVIDCMEMANQRRPGRFDARRAALYTGLQCEELAEKLRVLVNQGEMSLAPLCISLEEAASRFKRGVYADVLTCADHRELVDADFDIAWVSLGALEATAADAPGAVAHGIETNLAKFPGGKAILDANGKFQKPPGWKRPDFTPFIDPTRGVD